MITITIFGLDPYILRQLSKDLTDKIASIYEVEAKDVNFYAPEGLLIHEGVEQNTWQAIVKVNAPLKVKLHDIEHKVASIISNFLSEVVIHVSIEFSYYSIDSRYYFKNNDYPEFITEANEVFESDEDFDGEVDLDEVSLENAFEGFEEKLKGN